MLGEYSVNINRAVSVVINRGWQLDELNGPGEYQLEFGYEIFHHLQGEGELNVVYHADANVNEYYYRGISVNINLSYPNVIRYWRLV